MKCSKCGLRLVRAKDGYKSEVGTNVVQRVEQWICSNKNCDSYAGSDLSKPKVVENTVNETLEPIDF